jgi:hypothetical protein
VVRKDVLLSTVIITLTPLFRDGYHLLIMSGMEVVKKRSYHYQCHKFNHQHSNKGDHIFQVIKGSSLVVKQAGNSTLNFNHTSFKLTNILYCPYVFASFLFINQLSLDNDYYFVLTGIDFYVKKNMMGHFLLQRLVEKDYYFDNDSFPVKDQCRISPYNDNKMLTCLFSISHAITIPLNNNDTYS